MNVTAAEQLLHLFALYLFFYREKSDALLLFASKILQVCCGENSHVSHSFTC